MALAPKDAQIWITHTQLATVVINFIQAVRHLDIGYENAKKTLPEFLLELDRLPKVRISVEDLEDLLCAVNLKTEATSFFTAKEGENFDSFLKGLLAFARAEGCPLVFDRKYNTIDLKEKDNE